MSCGFDHKDDDGDNDEDDSRRGGGRWVVLTPKSPV